MRFNLKYLIVDSFEAGKLYHSVLYGIIEIFKKDNYKFDEDSFIKEIEKNIKLLP